MGNELLHYQALIIGFGKAGKNLAAYLATQGWRVALAEQSAEMYGGTCINIACIPTKSLVHSSEIGVPYPEAIAEKNRLTGFLRQRNLVALTASPQVTLYNGRASFVSPKQVQIHLSATGGTVRVEAERIFINTGAQPRLPALPGLRGNPRVFTSTTLMEQTTLPERLVILGGGFIGLEFASIYARFGAAVTVLETGPTFLPREDEDFAGAVRTVLDRKGIRIETRVQLLRVESSATADEVVYEDEHGQTQRVAASAILVATGREPVTAGLNLPAAGVVQDERGFISVNERLQTNVPHIWALGDVNGGPQFTYISLDDFRIVRDQLFGAGTRSTADRRFVASTVFITPPLAHVGLREKEARALGHDVKVATLPAAASVRAQILRQTEGLLKAVVEVGTDRILGCTLLCAEAGEIINVVQLAMQAGLPYTALRDHIYTHPSMAEVLNDLFAKV
ncbi:FAD-dependent oxidoreductase [Hymenobacter negativus]|uniref:FAD-dependent oxidoreductase n=1 Tax=Hymenobacter negativus TaxID=2795026 RepID=A0ABS3QLV4_9BACT|nr:FAD-dependent oxidoreductase [Hymenobacter negativus]MBO2012112.1 FAD-dependent oxidoreductase [Hymenobacter negativus]